MTKFIVIAGKKQAGKTTAAKHLKELLISEYKKKKKKEFFEKNKAEMARGELIISPTIGIPCGLVKITSFAEPIKDFCINVLGLESKQVYGTNEEKDTPTHIMWENMPTEIKSRYSFPHCPKGTLKPNGSVEMRPVRKFLTGREVMQIFGTDVMRNFFDYDIWAKAPFKKYTKRTDEYIIIDDCRFPNEANAALDNGALLIYLKRDVFKNDLHASETALDDYDESNYHYVIDNNDLTIEQLYKEIDKIIETERI